MKAIFLTAVCYAFVLGLQAQMLPANSSGSSAGTIQRVPQFQVTERGPNHRVWEWAEYETAPDGTKIPHLHRYTELASGLNFRNASGQWEESEEEIELLPNGAGASASKGQHKVIFPANISNGQIELNTPDGKWLRSQVLGLAYFDSSSGKSVLIAELKSCAGVIQSSNVVLYSDAFTDLKASVRYTYTRAGFEQDIILREQPPSPSEYGLNPETTRIEVMTEFFDPPVPVVESRNLQTSPGVTLPDETLGFGVMKIGRGKAFSQDDPGKEIPVAKQWLKLEGRDFLIEEVSLPNLKDQLEQLPAAKGASLNVKSSKIRRTASLKRDLPQRKLAKNEESRMKLAQGPAPVTGLVLDYVTTSSTYYNYTFQGDTTYYISGQVDLSGTVTVEGGAVIKYASGSQLTISYPPKWVAGAYRPVILTAKDDNSAGETISGSTGTPSGYYASCALCFGYTPTSISNFRISYAQTAITVNMSGNPVFSNGQLVNCNSGFEFASTSINLINRNLLFANVICSFNGISAYSSVDAQNSTFSIVYTLVSNPDYYSSISLKNCVLANVNYLGLTPSGNNNGFYSSPVFGTSTFTNTFNPFRTVGAGSFYLTNGCSFLNAGTTNIDSTLLGDLRKKTTSPPIVYSNVTVSVDTVLNPQAQRDADQPDLGYHYDPIDYIASTLAVTNATLTITSGTVIGNFNDSAGIWMQEGSSISSIGTPLAPNWFTRYTTVQEQATLIGPYAPGSGVLVNGYHTGMPAPNGIFQFSKFSFPAGSGYHLYHYSSWGFSNLTVGNCEFWNGQNYLAGANNSTAALKNNLFARSSINAMSSGTTNVSLVFSNNLFWNSGSVLLYPGNNTNSWRLFDNFFDTCTISSVGGVNGVNGNNAYLACNKQLSPTSTNNVALTSFTYASGPLGNFYQISTNLVNKGSTTANAAGLYHFTTQTNQAKEAITQLDIGYHYVALDGNNNPFDIDGDGIPDYLQDPNGSSPFAIFLTTPTSGDFFKEPAIIPIHASLNDWTSSVTNVEFFQGAVRVTGISTPPYNYTWPLVAAGPYTLTAVAYDLAGLSATSAPVNITVTNLCGY